MIPGHHTPQSLAEHIALVALGAAYIGLENMYPEMTGVEAQRVREQIAQLTYRLGSDCP